MVKRLGNKGIWCGLLLSACLVAAGRVWAEPTDEDNALSNDPKYNETISKLNSMKTSLDFTDAEMTDVIEFLQQLSGINFVIDQRVYKDMRAEDLKVTIQVKEVPLKTALRLILNLRGLTAEYRDGALLVMPKKALEEETYLHMYDVRDLMFHIHDFPGPEISLKSDAGDSGVSAAFSDAVPTKFEDPTFLQDLIKQNCGPDTWDRVEGCSIAMAQNGVLLVNQSKSVHKEIERLINLLRMYK